MDIHYYVAIMSRYFASPREGHLEQVFCIFAYLKRNPVYKIVLDSTPVDWDEDKFLDRNWEDFHPDARITTLHVKITRKGSASQLLCRRRPRRRRCVQKVTYRHIIIC